VEQPSESGELVSLRAERNGRVLSWDVHPILAASVGEHLEAAGWVVTISRDDGPRRRLRPRIEVSG
jgi:hypothetical protein